MLFDPIPMPAKLLADIYLFCRAYPLGRPRMRKDGSGIYQPLENQAVMRDEMLGYHREEPLDKPMCCEVRLFYQKPAYQSSPHIIRYDVDNIAKAVLDNLVWCNIIAEDSLIVRLDVTKAYSAEDYLIVRLYEVGTEVERIPAAVP